MRAHNRRSGASGGRGAITGLIINLFGSTAASAAGQLAGRDRRGGGWWLVCLTEGCEEPPKAVRSLPAKNSPIWDCPRCGGRRTPKRLPSDSGKDR
jgi:hypothetical protein